MPQSAFLLPLDQFLRVVPSQNALVLPSQEILVPNLVLGHQKHFAGWAVEHVGRRSLAEGDGVCPLGAEYDHVSKVAAVLLQACLVARVLSEDAA